MVPGNQMSNLLLSILTAAVPERFGKLASLCAALAIQIGDKAVEHLVLVDNRRRTIGEKRDALLRAAKGNYIAFVDDDDSVTPDYIESLLSAMETGPDVITFQQQAIINGASGEIEFGLGNDNEPFKPGGRAKRNAWHVCAWRRSLAILSSFPATNYGEDWNFAEKLCGLKGLRSVHISRVLHCYNYSDATTLAPP
jgi:glycosyltransferase involved in cell wall biosynthesis